MNTNDQAPDKATGLKRAGDMTDQNITSPTFDPPEAKGVEMNPSDPCIISFRDPDSPISEEYRKLKTVILRMTRSGSLNSIMVTSAISGEGKSVTSSNLAVMLAREYGLSVLLIDADLRRPSLQNYLGMPPRVGLADCLEDRIDAGRAIVTTGVPKLSFMSAGKPVENPSELLSSQIMSDFLLELKQRYQDRYIIIDTAPILLFAETQAMSLLVDGVLVVVKESGVSLKGLAQMFDILKSANILGVVYNNASATNLTERYHNHYQHYYSENRYVKKQEKR